MDISGELYQPYGPRPYVPYGPWRGPRRPQRVTLHMRRGYSSATQGQTVLPGRALQPPQQPVHTQVTLLSHLRQVNVWRGGLV